MTSFLHAYGQPHAHTHTRQATIPERWSPPRARTVSVALCQALHTASVHTLPQLTDPSAIARVACKCIYHDGSSYTVTDHHRPSSGIVDHRLSVCFMVCHHISSYFIVYRQHRTPHVGIYRFMSSSAAIDHQVNHLSTHNVIFHHHNHHHYHHHRSSSIIVCPPPASAHHSPKSTMHT